MSPAEISAQDVKALRERTGAGMMDCKKALSEADGDIERAIEILRVKQGKKVQDLGERVATEGTVQAYVHAGAKVGVLIEVDCNTDFVATNEDFVRFARDVAMQIARTSPPSSATVRRASTSSRRPISPRTSARRSSLESSTPGLRASCCSSRRCTTRSSTARPFSSCATS
jgi:translation elongation factor Ts